MSVPTPVQSNLFQLALCGIVISSGAFFWYKLNHKEPIHLQEYIQEDVPSQPPLHKPAKRYRHLVTEITEEIEHQMVIMFGVKLKN